MAVFSCYKDLAFCKADNATTVDWEIMIVYEMNIQTKTIVSGPLLSLDKCITILAVRIHNDLN